MRYLRESSNYSLLSSNISITASEMYNNGGITVDGRLAGSSRIANDGGIAIDSKTANDGKTANGGKRQVTPRCI
jgi:hypothetical protein